jgi:hypothetical protein
LGLKSALVRICGAGRALPLEMANTLGELISVWPWYSATVPDAQTALPTATLPDGALLVKTKTPSEVALSPSPASCIKNPVDRSAVTMP